MGFMVSNDRRMHGNQHAHTVRKVFRVSSSCPVAPDADMRRPIRARLLGGASSVALSVASMIVALGVCMPGDAQAQTTVNPVQTTRFDLLPAQNPIVFGAGTNIDTTATANVDAVDGGNGTAWDVTNQGKILGANIGIFLIGAGSSVTNANTISGATSNGVQLFAGGAVTNPQGATISGGVKGVEGQGGPGAIIKTGNIPGGLEGDAGPPPRGGAVSK